MEAEEYDRNQETETIEDEDINPLLCAESLKNSLKTVEKYLEESGKQKARKGIGTTRKNRSQLAMVIYLADNPSALETGTSEAVKLNVILKGLLRMEDEEILEERKSELEVINLEMIKLVNAISQASK